MIRPILREVLIDKAASFGKDRTQKRMKILLGEGMITSDGETHNRGAASPRPPFTAGASSAMQTQIVELAAGFRAEWKAGDGNRTLPRR